MTIFQEDHALCGNMCQGGNNGQDVRYPEGCSVKFLRGVDFEGRLNGAGNVFSVAASHSSEVRCQLRDREGLW